MRLIDADHLIQIVCGATIISDGFKDVFRKLVAGEPTVDRPTRSQFKRMAVQLGYEPVVRCKDCKYWQDNNDGYPHEECRWGHGETPDANDFCSYGERKEGADNAPQNRTYV